MSVELVTKAMQSCGCLCTDTTPCISWDLLTLPEVLSTPLTFRGQRFTLHFHINIPSRLLLTTKMSYRRKNILSIITFNHWLI